MCGIAGIIGNYVDISNVAGMVKAMRRRGPDDSGTWINEDHSCSLGHTRLSIIDVTPDGHQPMHILNNRYSIVFNGEIYNYKEIKVELEKHGVLFNTKSDTEVILWGWHIWQEKIVDKLRGMFAFCIWDEYNRKAYLVRDRLGIKPLLYYFSKQHLVFASSLNAMRASGKVKSKISSKGFFDILSTGAVAQPETIIDEVYCVAPGTILTIQDGLKQSKRTYWDLSKVEPHRELIGDMDLKSVIHRTRILLEEACQFHLVSDVPVGSFLSGGVDSTVITALMAKCSTQKIQSFTIGFEDEEYLQNECHEASIAASYIGTDHTQVILNGNDILGNFDDFIESIDQPSIDGLNTYWISKIAKNQVKVALSGVGADEIFAGYDSFLMMENADRRNATGLEKVLGKMYPMFPNRLTFQSCFNVAEPLERLSFFRQIMKSSRIKKALQAPYKLDYSSNHQLNYIESLKTESNDPVLQFSKFEINGYLKNTLLRDTDALSMSQSLEVRPIFLDHKLVEFAMAIPGAMKLKNGVTKYVLKEAASDLLPPNFFNRKKKGFSFPISSWINTILKPRITDILNSSKSSEYFQKKYLQYLIKNIDDANLSSEIWLIFVFLSWINKIIEI